MGRALPVLTAAHPPEAGAMEAAPGTRGYAVTAPPQPVAGDPDVTLADLCARSSAPENNPT